MTIRLKLMLRPLVFFFAFSLFLTGCSKETAPPGQGLTGTDTTSASFVNKAWQVSRSSSVTPGTLYVFLSEGTLLITSPNNKPILGTWKYENGELFMVEEGLPYKTDVLQLDADQFSIRSHNPGEPAEITLVPAEAGPLAQ